MIFDFRNVQSIDNAGLALLQALQERCRERGIGVRHQGASAHVERFLGFLETREAAVVAPGRLQRESWIARLGLAFTENLKDAREMVSFAGGVVTAIARVFTGARRFRWRETFYYTQLCGANAMPIVSLISFLMGLIMAFQAAVQLRQFGGNIFVADLLSLAFTRELGPFLTAVVLAGFMREAYEILALSDVLTGLSKSFAFSILLGAIGCLRGLQTEQGADSVGRQTTSAVVSGIFLIIFADAIFTEAFARHEQIAGWFLGGAAT